MRGRTNGQWIRWGLLTALQAGLSTIGAGQAYVRLRDDLTQARSDLVGSGRALGPPASAALSGSGYTILPIALHGQALAGGQLQPLAWANPCVVAPDGSIAFVAGIAGGARNQGIFVGNAAGVHAIAIGCGGGGGSGQSGTCGDPAPGGGTFAGFFGGTAFAPAIDEDGDVLFLADVAGAASPRALFLFVIVSQSIVRIAGVGDPSPLGSLAEVGPGTLAAGRVVFAVRAMGRPSGELLLWRAGVLQRFAAIGDAVPGGGTIGGLATEAITFVDGTSLPIGPLPALNGCSDNTSADCAFAVQIQGGAASAGILVRRAGVDSWYLRTGDAAPGGGTFAGFAAPALSGRGEIAVFADFRTGSTMSSGWFVGQPGAFRRALAFFDPVDGGQCRGLAWSRNPMRPLDDAGNLIVWCDLADLASTAPPQDRIVVCGADGSVEVLARRGAPAPAGGVFGTMNAWPAAASTGRVTISAATPGGASNGHFVAVTATPLVAASPCASPGGALRVFDQGEVGSWFALAVAPTATEVQLPPLGVLRIGPTAIAILVPFAPYPGAAAPHTASFAVPADPALSGTALHFQSLAIGTTAVLTNAASCQLR